MKPPASPLAVLLVTAPLTLLAPASHGQCFHLEPSPVVGVGGTLQAGCTGDLDGDGRADIAVPDLSGDMVQLLLGDGAGSFVPGGTISLPPGTQPSVLECCDLDGDGDLDLLVGSETGGSVWIMSNAGGAEFPPPYQVVTGVSPARITCADVDLDADEDIVVTDRSQDVVHVLTNDGGGSFSLAPAGFAVLGLDPFGLVCADFNNDGAPDALTANVGSSNVDVLLNDGTGSMFAFQSYAAPLGARTVIGADLDQDGDRDAAVADDGVTVLVNDGSGFFQAVAYAGTSGALVLAADLDKDAQPELIFETPGGLGALVGAPPGYTVLSKVWSGPTPDHLWATDLDGDSADDLVLLQSGPPGGVQGLLSIQDTAAEAILSTCGANPAGSAAVVGEPYVGTVVLFQVDNPLGTQTPGSLPLVGVSTKADPAWPCGTAIPGWGMSAPGAAGELQVCIEPSCLALLAPGPAWQGPGQPASVPIAIPANCVLVGETLYLQGALVDPVGSILVGLTEAAQLDIGAF